MEQLRTTSIAEKLQGLDTLPAGYTANLDSKWALLERSREGETKAKKKGFVWMRAAAAVLLCSFVVLFWPDREPALSELKNSPAKKNKQPLESSQQESPQASLKRQSARKYVADKKNISEILIVHAGLQQGPLTITTHSGDSITDSQPLEQLATEAAPPKKKKTRYVQMDFGEIEREAKIAPSYCTPTRFKLFNSGQQNPEKESQTNSSTAHLRINL